MATKHTRQPQTDRVRLAEIYRQTSDGLHDWITRGDDPTDPAQAYDDPTVVLGLLTDDELIDYLVELIGMTRTSSRPEVRRRYDDFATVVADEAKARLASAGEFD